MAPGGVNPMSGRSVRPCPEHGSPVPVLAGQNSELLILPDIVLLFVYISCILTKTVRALKGGVKIEGIPPRSPCGG
jgi:hypothetical protein